MPQGDVNATDYGECHLEVSRREKPLRIAIGLGQMMPKAESMAIPYLPFAVDGFDRDATWIRGTLFDIFAAKATGAVSNCHMDVRSNNSTASIGRVDASSYQQCHP